MSCMQPDIIKLIDLTQTVTEYVTFLNILIEMKPINSIITKFDRNEVESSTWSFVSHHVRMNA